MTIITFDGTTAIGSANDVPHNYAGLVWTNFSSVGRIFVHANLAGTGFESVLRGDVVGYAPEHPGVAFDSRIAAPAGETLHFKGGIMASIYSEGQHVTFHGYRHGHEVISKTFTIGQDDHSFHLRGFARLDEVRLTTTGGTDVDPNDQGTGHSIAFDNLNIVIKAAGHHHAAPDHVHDFGPDLALPHLSDWPLA